LTVACGMSQVVKPDDPDPEESGWKHVYPPTDQDYYRNLFKSVVDRDRFADHLDAMHKSSDYVRAELRHRIGISVTEDKILKTIAHDCLDDLARIRQQRAVIYRSNMSLEEASEKVSALWQQEDARVDSAIATLKSSLGQDRFAIMDNYLRTSPASLAGYVVSKCCKGYVLSDANKESFLSDIKK
jgi:hypothetical protein